MNDTIDGLSPRENQILNLINQSKGLSRQEIEGLITPYYRISKPTLIRDLGKLVGLNLISISGKAKATVYKSSNTNPIMAYFDIEKYFELDPDERLGAKKSFDFSVFDRLENLFTSEQRSILENSAKSFAEETKNLEPEILKKELERFTIELSWKSSKIEGNTYSLLQTEQLITQFKKAPNKTNEEAQMILNHKLAFDSILSKKLNFADLSVTLINQLHNILVKDLNINPGIRKNAVGITGTVYKPLDNEFQIQEALEKTVKAINLNKNPFEKAVIAETMIAYIQPYIDGNKRTSRMLTNAILLAHDLYPLSYRSIDEEEYKKALIIFYEQGSIDHIKRIFIDQFIFANKTYFA